MICVARKKKAKSGILTLLANDSLHLRIDNARTDGDSDDIRLFQGENLTKHVQRSFGSGTRRRRGEKRKENSS